MKNNALREFVSLRNSLTTEKAELESRLREINAALGISETETSSQQTSVATAAVTQPRKKMSAAARAKIAAGQRARWAARRGQKVEEIGSPQATATKSPAADVVKGKRTMSPAARKRLAAAAKARWAKAKAAGKTSL